ncbi:MAG: DUF1538 domain-containing protein [Pseudomonadota bacterium]
MVRKYRFGDYQREARSTRERLSFNRLVPKLSVDSDGRVTAGKIPKFEFTAGEAVRLVQPYVSVRFMEQVKAVVPLGIYLALFQILFLQQMVADSWVITGGLFAVIVGLMLFMEGLTIGLMPFGTLIGDRLPRKSSLPLVLLITLLLGVGVTFAEPAIGALRAAGQIVSVEQAPYLYAILNFWADQLVLVVGVSVGLAAVLGTLRFLQGWSLKPLIYMALLPVLALSVLAAMDEELRNVLGLAWDCGAVTTGPVTVPLVLSLGIGIAASGGKGDSELSGFGIVTLASLFPIIGVLLLCFYVSSTVEVAEILEMAQQAAATDGQQVVPWYERTPFQEIVLGVRAILPLVLFLFIVLKFIVKEPLENQGYIFYGIGLCIVGMCIFNIGLTYGLSKLGAGAGSLVPSAFMEVNGVANSPIYEFVVGLILVLVFAWILGFGATLAEPALNALGVTTERLTNGIFKKKTLVHAVSVGVAFGIATGVAKLVFDLPLIWFVVPPYLLSIVLTFLSTEEFVNVAWDSAGVTTGPITVPLVLAMGLGLGEATDAVEGFGILCLASIGPILSVLIVGLWARYQVWRRTRAASQGPTESEEIEGRVLT